MVLLKLCELSIISITIIMLLYISPMSIVSASNNEKTIESSSMYRPIGIVQDLIRNKRGDKDYLELGQNGRISDRGPFRSKRYASGHPHVSERTTPHHSNEVGISKFIPIVPRTCIGSYSFCTTSENYPATHVNDILKNKTKWINVIDEIDQESIGNRFGEDTEDNEPICLAEECVIYPKVALNKDNDWFFIVNNDKFKQGVRVELCSMEGNQCKLTEGFPVRAICRQKYIYRTMVALDYYGVEQKDKFKMPSCCSCSLVTEATAAARQSRQSPRSEIGVEKCQKFVQH